MAWGYEACFIIEHDDTLKRKIDCKGYWYEYIKCLELTDEKFLHYVKTDEFIRTKKAKSISSSNNKSIGNRKL